MGGLAGALISDSPIRPEPVPRRTFDARLAAHPASGDYCRRLAEGLARIVGGDLILLVDPHAGWLPPPGPRPVRLSGPVDTPTSAVRLGAAAPYGLLHIPHTAAPLWHRGPLVLTIQDPLRLLGRPLGRWRLVAALARAQRIVVHDEAARDMLRHLLPGRARQVRVLPATPATSPETLAERHLEVYEEAETAWNSPPWP
ncbi:hypothetical protein L6R50_01505 [Myxococcota bacterium]|nr:hypothetical protein [Myxococcota bacterium]